MAGVPGVGGRHTVICVNYSMTRLYRGGRAMCSRVDAGQTPENAISCEESLINSHVMRQIPKSLQLDAIDRGILNELQNNGRLSNVELAGRVHLSPSACLRRGEQLA